MSIAFDQIEVGDELPAMVLTLTHEQVKQYAVSAHMPGGRFMSDEEARAEGLPGQIVPGNMSLALFSRLLTSLSPNVRIRRLSATFRGLVHPGAPIRLQAVVTEKNEADNILECDLILENEDGERRVTGTATVELPVTV